jgi:DNA-binding GntR family transcriptional regulator
VRKVSAEHDAILQAVLNHDQEQAVALLQAHYMRTAAVIEADLRNAALSLAG